MVIIFRASKEPLTYNVLFETYNPKAKRIKNTLSYHCDVQQKSETFKGYVVNFKRYDIILNNTKIHDVMNEIALISGELIHDLDLEISNYGEILRIKNYKEILKEWERVKSNLIYTYQGEIVDSMLDELEKNILDEKQFINSLYKDPFFCNFLGDIYHNYANVENYEIESKIFNFGGMRSISIIKSYEISENEDRSRTIMCRSIIPEKEVQRIKEEQKVNEIWFNQTSIHNISSAKHIKSVSLNQELFIDKKLFTSYAMSITL